MKNTLLLLCAVCTSLTLAAEVTLSDFKPGSPRWHAEHQVTQASTTDAGLSFTVTDEDPWLGSPMLQLPAFPATARRLIFSITCAPTPHDDSWQLFYSQDQTPFNEKDSCRLLPVGKPPYTRFAVEVPLKTFKPGPFRVRLDPPGVKDAFTVQRLAVDFAIPLWTYEPTTPPPLDLPASDVLELHGSDWTLAHHPSRFGAFRYTSSHKTVENLSTEPVVYLDQSGAVRTLDLATAPLTTASRANELVTQTSLTDADGHRWTFRRVFSAATPSQLRITTHVDVSGGTARLLHLPALTLLVDRASVGHKHQALLAGLEYLGDEPSSNMKEIRTVEHNRLIPAEYRLSAPLAVFTDSSRWLAAEWNQLSTRDYPSGPSPFGVVFDTPDRLFKSGGHLLAFWAPAVGSCRRESELDLYAAQPLSSATQSVTLRSGPGATIAEALEALITPDTLPPPDAVDTVDALQLLAHGWLDSTIRKGTQVRHAIGEGFPYHAAADAPLLMQYLAAMLKPLPQADKPLQDRLTSTSAEMLAAVPKPNIPHACVSHIHKPAPVLVAGDVPAFLAQQTTAQKDLNRQLVSGIRRWKPQPGRPDFGETLGADHCNGFTSMSLVTLLGHAVWSGDEQEIAKSLAILDKVTSIYHGTVPCGAQPWEMPLHTPDIVASANLARAYTLGYLLKPNPAYLREARHWAYTGLSMVYLVPPPFTFDAGADPVGRYATCAVMGATHWAQPNWIGRPVQWCGLVYAAALWDLARIEPNKVSSAFWWKIATGITTSGVRQSHPLDDPEAVGCLPDSWNLEAQNRYIVPINPGTVEENFAECIRHPYYSLRRLANGSLLHVPGDAEPLPPQDGALRCRIAGWPEHPFQVVLTRLDTKTGTPVVTLDGKPVESTYHAATRALIVTLPARAAEELTVRR